MSLGLLLRNDPPPDKTRQSDESTKGFLGSGVTTVQDISTRIRDVASDGVAAVESGTEELKDDVTDRLEAKAVNLVESQLEQLDEYPTTDERVQRRLELFLKRHDLERERLAEGTLKRLRRQFESEELDTIDELLDVITGKDHAGSHSDGDQTTADETEFFDGVDELVTERFEQFCTDASVDPDQSLNEIIDDLVAQDVITLGHAVESTLEECHPQPGASPHSGNSQPTGGVGVSDIERGDSPRSFIKELLETGNADAPPGGPGPGYQLNYPGPEDHVRPPGIGRPSRGRPVAAIAALSMVVLFSGRATNSPGISDLTPAIPGSQTEITTVLRVLEMISSFDVDGLDVRPSGSKALVALFIVNLVAMSVGAWLSRTRAPPIPDEIQGPNGEVLVTEAEITQGKKAFQANGLMNHGSILGNGSYFGSDLTADALSAKVGHMRDYYARERGEDSFEELDDDEQAIVAQRVEDELDTEIQSEDLIAYSGAQAYAHRQIREEYVDRYYHGRPEHGIPDGAVDSPEQAERLADFACWTAWMAHTNRPGSDHSFTNDWPYAPGSGNRPTGQVLGWSTISLVLLIAGGGIGVWAYHTLDFAEPVTEAVDIPDPDSVTTTPTQYVAAWYVPVAGALFLTQVFTGALLAHYYVERDDFFEIGERFDIDVLSLLPFSIVRTWHINLAILWVTTLWLAGGLFIPGLFSETDPPGQARGAAVLLAALVVTTVGAFVGVWLGIQGKFGSPEDGELWWLLGSEGLEYLETGRVWKLMLLAGLVGWTGLVLRGARQIDESPVGLGHFMTYAGGSIALLFGASMLYTPETNIAVTEFWRWWVVHMWVEGVFEFFVTAVTAIALVSMDLLDKTSAEQAIMFEVFAIMGAGIVGVSHHYWWVGLPDFWVPLGTTFSTLEFIPLMFILHQSFEEYQTLQAQTEAFPYKLPLLFILGSSLWNFVGGGVLGFFINIPGINYFEHGTYLTVAHAHTATFGAFGLLALGLGTYILRVVTPEAAWEPAWFRGAFWLTNAGLIIMTVASLLPLGFNQLETVYTEGYDAARSPEFYERPENKRLLWARSLGDAPMILGATAFTVGAVRHLLAARQQSDGEMSSEGATNSRGGH